jgi:hypothetical protein
MSKYKNKQGIELNFTGNDMQSELVKEVIEESIKILNMYDRSCKISMGMAMMNTKKFLKTNFDIGSKSERSDEWRIEQFNRNRSMEDQVNTIKELENKTNEIFNS